VIDRKRIFLFWPKTNIRQENAAEYSADNKYSAQGGKYCKNVNLKRIFLEGLQLQLIIKIYGQQKHTVHKTMSSKSLLS
jgi:hypothetical protein